MERPRTYSFPTSILILLTILSIFFILGWFIGGCTSEKEEVIRERIIRDTTTLIKVDTITFTKVVEVERVRVDTVYYRLDDGKDVSIPIDEYRFTKDGVYDITARGYGVTLPSVTVFPTTETKYITNTIEREVLVRKWDFYLGGGIYGFSNKVAPMVGLCVKTPNRWLLSANVGICDNKFAYGASVYYRLGKK